MPELGIERNNSMHNYYPTAQGMYNPLFEHDACGMGFVADIKGRKSRDIIDKGLSILKNLKHRGAVGADPLTGDGAGILIQTPHKLILSKGIR